MTDRRSLCRRLRAALGVALIGACAALAATTVAGAVTVDPQKVASGVGLPPVAGVPELPAVNVPDPPSVPAPAVAQPSQQVAPSGTTASSSSPASPAGTVHARPAPGSAGSEGSISGSAGRTTPTGSRPTARRSGARGPVARVAHSPSSGPGLARAARAADVRPRLAAQASGNPLDAIGRHLPLPAPVPDWSKPIILALLLMSLGLAVRSRVMAVRARRLEAQRRSLIEDVGAMQVALAPDVPPRLGALGVSVAYRPAEGPAAGGDFYDVFSLDATRVAIVLGDVSGHGREALARAALTRFTLRAHLELGLEPRAALALAGRRPAEADDEFATVAIGIYEAASGTLTYATAGHPPPIVLGAGRHRPITVCAAPPIGWGIPTGRRQTTVSLPAGAVACFFTDGLADARSRGEALGRERIAEVLAALGPRPQARLLLERLREAADEVPDDMAACIIEARTAATESVCVEEIELDARQLAEGRAQRFLEACAVPELERAHALDHARALAGRLDTALVRVTFGAAGRTSVTVTPAQAPMVRPQPAPRLAVAT